MKNNTILFSMLILFCLSCNNQQVEKNNSSNQTVNSEDISSKESSELKYTNGQLKEKGKYEDGEYIQCCTGGLCPQSYKYKTEDWEYFYPNGRTKAKGKYRLKSLNLMTSCQGGDDILFGLIDDSWEFYNEENRKIELTDSMRMEFEKVSIRPFSNTFLIPNKERTEIEWVSKE